MADNKPEGNRKEARRTNKRRASFIVGNKQQSLLSRFGHIIRVTRERKSITQTELAKLANINRSYLSELERGLVSISLERAERLAKALECNLRDLLE